MIHRLVPVLAVSFGTFVVADDPEASTSVRTRNVAIVVHEGVELLDFAGPGEVFHAAGPRAGDSRTSAFNVYTVAPTKKTCRSMIVNIQPDYSIDDCPTPDILVVPGGGTGTLLRDEAFMNWVRSIEPETEIMFSVCTGAFVYAKLGLLDGLKATTHWSAIQGLRDGSDAEVIENTRFVDNGHVVTSAGISAGIDGALHIVARLHGLDVATATARYMEYDWRMHDAYASSYPKTNPSLGDLENLRMQAQSAAGEQRWEDALAGSQAVLARLPNDPNATYQVGRSLHALGRLDEAIPWHERAATMPSVRVNALYNLACAQALQGHTKESLDALEQSVESGFTQLNWMQGDADLASVRGDARYKALVERLSGG